MGIFAKTPIFNSVVKENKQASGKENPGIKDMIWDKKQILKVS